MKCVKLSRSAAVKTTDSSLLLTFSQIGATEGLPIQLLAVGVVVMVVQETVT